MKLFVSLLLFALTGVDFVYPRIELSSNVTNITGEICPETVQFTCIATDFETTLFWGFNDLSSMFRYVLNTMDIFPRTIFENDNVTVIISSALQNPNDLDRANFTSTLTVSLSHLIYFNVQRVVCGTSVENVDYNLMLSDVTVRAPPSHPVFACSVADDAESVTFDWNSSYNSNYSVDHYCVESATCSTCNISPTAPYVCDGLQVGAVYPIIFKAVNCDVQQGAAESVTVNLQGTTQAPSNVEVISIFNSSVLTQVTVKWSDNADKYSVCDHKSTTYIVTLQNTINASVVHEVDVSSCEDSMCSTDIAVSELEGNYSVSVHAVSIIGTNSTIFPSVIPANATSLLRTSFNFTNCITYVTCFSDVVDEGNCGISYSSISDSETVTGTLNSPFALPLLIPDTRYVFVANLEVDSNFTVEILTIFITGNFDPRLTGSNIGVIVVGIFITVIAITVEVCDCVAIALTHFCTCLPYTKNRVHKDRGSISSTKESETAGSLPVETSFPHAHQPTNILSEREAKHTSLALYGLNLIPVCIAILLWIFLGGVVGQQQNTCDVSWQMSRNNLIVASFVFAIFSLIVSLLYLIFIWRRWDIKVSNALRNLTSSCKVYVIHDSKNQSSDNVVQESPADQPPTPPKQGQPSGSSANGEQEQCGSGLNEKDNKGAGATKRAGVTNKASRNTGAGDAHYDIGTEGRQQGAPPKQEKEEEDDEHKEIAPGGIQKTKSYLTRVGEFLNGPEEGVSDTGNDSASHTTNLEGMLHDAGQPFSGPEAGSQVPEDHGAVTQAPNVGTTDAKSEHDMNGTDKKKLSLDQSSCEMRDLNQAEQATGVSGNGNRAEESQAGTTIPIAELD